MYSPKVQRIAWCLISTSHFYLFSKQLKSLTRRLQQNISTAIRICATHSAPSRSSSPWISLKYFSPSFLKPSSPSPSLQILFQSFFTSDLLPPECVTNPPILLSFHYFANEHLIRCSPQFRICYGVRPITSEYAFSRKLKELLILPQIISGLKGVLWMKIKCFIRGLIPLQTFSVI